MARFNLNLNKKALVSVFVSFIVILLLIAVVRAVFPGVLDGFENANDRMWREMDEAHEKKKKDDAAKAQAQAARDKQMKKDMEHNSRISSFHRNF